jgi:drug/metabolite transporter (DMT)-like permease
MTAEQQKHFTAVRMLAATTILWSLSFPLVKAIGLVQTGILPGSNSWFHASLTGFGRFACAAGILAVFGARKLRAMTRLEILQGVGLGFFGGSGILLQMDGLGHTSASTSAFLTQAFCVLVPIVVAIRDRMLPPLRVVVAIGLMMLGVAILSDFNLRTFQLGRGEAETLISAIFFAGQIVWLERRIFLRNNVTNFSVAMFVTMALMSLPIMIASWNAPGDPLRCYSNPNVLVLSVAIILFCTIAAFVLMNLWQPFVSATEAAVIYGAEPVFASILALFLPGLISKFTGIHYPNEILTWPLLGGGLLILCANLVLQIQWRKKAETHPPSSAIS